MADAAILTETIPPYTVKRKAPLHAFTRENAGDMARRATEARMANLARKQEQPPVSPDAENARQITGFAHTHAREIEEIIAETLKEIKACTVAKDKQALAMTLDKLYGTWADLTGFERRGVSRGTKRKGNSSLSALDESPVDQ